MRNLVRFLLILIIMTGEIDSKPGLKAAVQSIIPNPIRNILKINTTESTTTEEPGDKEHGTLDFFGRDLVRGAGKAIGKVQDKIGFTASNNSSGLDADKGFFVGVVDAFMDKVQTIFPGTRWCGGGNNARSLEDLGKFNETDSCCREHDLCPESIPAGETKHGLHNTGLFTRSHCDCDSKFYQCLKTTNSVISTKLGFTYFTVLGPQCFQQDYAIVDCIRKKSGKCLEYSKDSKSEKRFQWFDNPTY